MSQADRTKHGKVTFDPFVDTRKGEQTETEQNINPPEAQQQQQQTEDRTTENGMPKGSDQAIRVPSLR